MTEPATKRFNWMLIFWVIIGFLVVAYFVGR